MRPVSPRLQSKRPPDTVKPALETIQRLLMAKGLAHHRKIARLSRRHGREYLLHGVKRRLARHQPRDLTRRHNPHDPFLLLAENILGVRG